MADDRLKNDDLQRDMGTTGREDQDLGKSQQTPGRNPQGGQQGGGYGGDEQSGQRRDPSKTDEDPESGGGMRGGQNR